MDPPVPLLVRELISARCRAALTSHKLEWLELWGSLAELELKWSTCELVYVGNTNVIQSNLTHLLITAYRRYVLFIISNAYKQC